MKKTKYKINFFKKRKYLKISLKREKKKKREQKDKTEE